VDRTVKIWQLPKPGESILDPLTLYGNSGAVYDVEISPDGKYVVSVGRDPTVRVYVLEIAELIQIAKSRLTRTWTTDECKKYLHADICPSMP